MDERDDIGNDMNKSKNIPEQLLCIEKLYPWQQKIIDSRNIFDSRTINFVVDDYCSGKSIISMYINIYGLGCKIPYSNRSNTIMSCAYAAKEPCNKLFIIDVPHSIQIGGQRVFLNSIEDLKNGNIKHKEGAKLFQKMIDSPAIWVLINSSSIKKINTKDNNFAKDKFKWWTIEDNNLTAFSLKQIFSDNIDQCYVRYTFIY